MPAISTSDLLRKLNWRYAVKKFDPSKKIPEEIWKTLEEVLILSPSSFGLQLWKFIVIQNADIRKKLTPLSWNQKQVEDCSHFVVFCHRTDVTDQDILAYAERMRSVRGLSPEQVEGYVKRVREDVVVGPRYAWAKEWMARQTYIALGNFMTSAALLGVDTCPMEGLEPEKYDRVLGLEEDGYQTVMACAAGYRHPDDRFQSMKKVRYSAEKVVTYIE